MEDRYIVCMLSLREFCGEKSLTTFSIGKLMCFLSLTLSIWISPSPFPVDFPATFLRLSCRSTLSPHSPRFFRHEISNFNPPYYTIGGTNSLLFFLPFSLCHPGVLSLCLSARVGARDLQVECKKRVQHD